VLREDLGLYLDACSEESYPPHSKTAAAILSLFNEAEELTTDAIQAGVRLPRTNVRKALVELGRNQLVVENPKDTWWLTRSLVLGTRYEEGNRLAARGAVISRCLGDYGPAMLLELANWSGWPQRAVHAAIDRFCSEGKRPETYPLPSPARVRQRSSTARSR